MPSYDAYAEAYALVDLLREDGLEEFADDVRLAIARGSTGTEIFMALRWNIRRILDTNKCSVATEAAATRLYIELDKALQ